MDARARYVVPRIAILVSLAVAGCQMGTRPSELVPATSPRGTEVELHLTDAGGRLTGELVAVRENDLLLDTSRGFTAVRYAAFGRAEFEDAPGVGRWRDAEGQRERLARYSRYPFGVSEELLRRLLAARDQEELRVIRQ